MTTNFKSKRGMNISELRIGNWVWPTNHVWPDQQFELAVWGPISRLTDNEVFFQSNWSTHLTFIQGIELSPSWLVAFGFNEGSKKLVDNGSIFNKGKIKLIMSGNEYLFKSNHTNINRVRYIHELQNLFKDYTGKELKIWKGKRTFSQNEAEFIKLALIEIRKADREEQINKRENKLRKKAEFYISDFAPRFKAKLISYRSNIGFTADHFDQLVEHGIIRIK